MTAQPEGRRVIVHAGFHKTGTSTVQKFLHSNGKQVWSRNTLVLPYKLRHTAARLALRYSRFGTSELLEGYAQQLKAVLSAINIGGRNAVISEENLSGRMPGRDGQAGYTATPDLMARTEQVIHDVFGPDTDVVFHFSTRAPQHWIKSTFKHNLRMSRLTLDLEDYAAHFGPAAQLDTTVDAVRAAVRAPVYSARLEDLTGALGPAQPIVDLMRLPKHRYDKLVPQTTRNLGPPDALIPELLALNRSSLDDHALETAKTDLLGKATP